MQPKVHISSMTTLPRRSARRRGESTFSQVSLLNSGASPRSGSEASFDITGCACPCVVVCDAHPERSKAVNPIIKYFIIGFPDESILNKLPYEKITEV